MLEYQLVWRDGVSTGSDSDRVERITKIEIPGIVTRSLPLPVLTPSTKF